MSPTGRFYLPSSGTKRRRVTPEPNHSKGGVRLQPREVKEHLMERRPLLGATDACYAAVVLLLLLLTLLAYAGIAVAA